MMTSEQIVRTEVTETLFGFYTDNEKKQKLSVCNITLPMTLNANMQPIISGLYDGHMGPLDQGVTCLTCSMGYVNCPGHPGHIELDVPVYYPLLFPSMFQILRSKCVFCHKLRMSLARVRYYLIKLKLIEMGETTIAEELYDALQPSILFNEDNDIVEEEVTTKKKSIKKDSNDIEEKLRMYEKRYESFSTSGKRKTLDANAKQLQRETIEEFQRAALAIKKCENCDAYSPPFRKDGFSKIFQKPMPKRLRKSMPSNRFKYRTALEYMNAHSSNKGDAMDEGHSQGGTDSDDDSNPSSDSDAEVVVESSADEVDKYLVPLEVEAQIQLLWSKNGEILDYIWKRCIRNDVKYGEAQGNKKQLEKHFSVNEEGWRIFFTRVVLVPPNKFRPAAKVGESTSEHPQNIHLIRILEHNSKIRLLQGSVDISRMNGYGNVATPAVVEDDKGMELSKLITSWIDLQNAVNCYIDSAKDPNPLGSQGAPSGIRQLLERKEGMFRRHMMGKRVNYCCRSVISPDNYIGTNEIGIPVKFAMALHYPTPVNDWNVKYLRTLVERGPNEYPGANQIETSDGRIIKLEKLSAMERAGKAKLLLATPGNKVYRHLIDGDVLLVNRQPTLQKPGIMAHKARVLRHVKEQTLRMHYANCNTYNADFDGDEMNCHFVQSELARAEATFICNNDNQYIGPTSGNPLRGLIQDHVAGGVKLTCKDTFLTKSEFQQLLYIAVTGLPGTEIVSPMEEMNIPLPAVWKPVKRWTGKQVISALMSHMCRAPLPSLHLDGKARTPATAFGAEHCEHEVIIRHGELLCGVLDKNAIGSVSLGVVHAVYELYGAELAGRLLNAFGRLFTYVLQDFGLTCGIADLILTKDADAERRKLLQKVGVDAEQGLLTFLKTTTGEEIQKTNASDASKPLSKSQRKDAEKRIGEFLAVDKVNQKVKLDGAMQSVINKSASDVIKACLPNGLDAPFLTNNFSIMVLTGAKGSAVNQSQISCFLGQQALEGQRVPLMVSGKSLPSFKSNDSSARAGGFVQDRFLTGVKPQEYYFHCMAGREGLVDTAVKTSRSGYLQRCLVKHLEELKIHYDNTVRDSGGNVVQFLYGEDGLDPIQASLLGGKANQMLFLARNNQALVHKFSLHQDFFNQGLEMESAQKHHQRVTEARKLVQDKSGTDLQTQLKVGSVVLARKKIHADTNWCRGNIIKNWVSAEIIKARVSDSGSHYFDLRYIDTNEVEKKVPVKLMVRPRMSAGGGPELSQAPKLAIYLIKAGLPETGLNTLSLASCIGAVSEKIQDAVTNYSKKNPDGVITAESSETTVTAEALELLVWVKYMRSMACPGEAVGCVAAQSVGEPSTQMTLNTFHLAGHGGANVTLGIPRLREIIMTASRALKTPTMLVPMVAGRDMISAKSLAAQLSRLSLSQLLHHKGGVEVGEYIDRNGSAGQWERKYRIRLVFQKPESIEAAFGLSFETIVSSIKKTFLAKLDHYIKYEQRRAGERVTQKNDPLKAFRAAGGDKTSSSANEGEDGAEDNDDDDQPSSSSSFKKASAGVAKVKELDSDEDEDEDGGDDNNVDEELGNLKLGGSGKEMVGYDEDDEEAEVVPEENDSDSDSEKDEKKKDLSGSSDSESDSGEESDEEKLSSIAKIPSKGAKTTEKASKKPKAAKTDDSENLKQDKEKGFIEIELCFPAKSRRLLMAQIAEKAASVTMVRFTKDIANAYPIQGEGLESADRSGVVVEGVNFEAIWALSDQLVDMNAIKSNDIYRILTTYGVEAARQCIVSEITGVFNVYGIDVNSRHLSLIADFMTRNGSYAAMNRIGMNECPSPFLQMSFETTCTFLTKAAQEGLSDAQESPSSRIVLGSVTKVGTGCFDLMLPLNDKQ